MTKSKFFQLILKLFLCGLVAILVLSIVKDVNVIKNEKKIYSKAKATFQKAKAEEGIHSQQDVDATLEKIQNLRNENQNLYTQLVNSIGEKTYAPNRLQNTFLVFFEENSNDYFYGANISLKEDDNNPWRLVYNLQYELKNHIESTIESYKTIAPDNFYLELLKTPINKKNREASSIRRFYDICKSILFEKISRSNYNFKLSYFINALIKSYEHITSNPQYEEILRSITEDFNDKRLLQIEDPELLELFSEIETTFETKENWDEYYNEWFSFWVNTFWVRRFKEKNMDIVYEILLEIQTYYNTFTIYDPDGGTFIYDDISEDKLPLLQIDNGAAVIVKETIDDWYKVLYNDTIVGFVHSSKFE